jgi:hypothetical protein
MPHVTPVTSLPGGLLAPGLLFLFSWVQLRHVGWALLTALAPLPGFIASALFTGESSALWYLPGFAAAFLLTAVMVVQLSLQPPDVAMRRSFVSVWPAILGGVCVIIVLSVIVSGRHIGFDRRGLFAISAIVSATVIVALGNRWLPAADDFIIRINRIGESRDRRIQSLDFLSHARWGWSIAGVALVMSVLGFFGNGGKLPASPMKMALAAAILLILCYATIRNGRRAFAILLAMVPAWLATEWIASRLSVATDNPDLLFALSVSVMPMLALASAAARHERAGESAETATRRGIEESGTTIFLLMVACALAVMAGAGVTRAAVAEGAALLVGGVAALIFVPSLMTMLYSFFPKRISLEEAFRKR